MNLPFIINTHMYTGRSANEVTDSLRASEILEYGIRMQNHEFHNQEMENVFHSHARVDSAYFQDQIDYGTSRIRACLAAYIQNIPIPLTDEVPALLSPSIEAWWRPHIVNKLVSSTILFQDYTIVHPVRIKWWRSLAIPGHWKHRWSSQRLLMHFHTTR